MKTCMECGEYEKCIEICLYVKKLIPAVEDGRNSEREALMDPSDLAMVADLYSLSDWNTERTRTSCPAVDLSALSASQMACLTRKRQRPLASRARPSRAMLRGPGQSLPYRTGI